MAKWKHVEIWLIQRYDNLAANVRRYNSHTRYLPIGLRGNIGIIMSCGIWILENNLFVMFWVDGVCTKLFSGATLSSMWCSIKYMNVNFSL